MRRIHFKPDKLEGSQRAWWDKWSKRSETATAKAIENHEADRDLGLNQKVWSDLKKWLFENVFDGKCAYCESRAMTTSYGDAEHYRPKSEVSVKDADGKAQIVHAGGEKHPGYFWLAFDWENLIPSCARCNSGMGKQTQFPTRNGHVLDASKTTSELDREEKPLLLHPYPAEGREDPHESVSFEEHGGISAHTEGGAETIKVCDLQRADLVEDRRAAREAAAAAWNSALSASGHDVKPLDVSIAEMKRPNRAYHRVWADYADQRLEQLKQQAARAR